MARLCYIVNKDKTLTVNVVSDDIQDVASVRLSWKDGKPVVALAGLVPWAMDEQAAALKALSDIIYALGTEDGKWEDATPHAIVKAIDDAKGAQAVRDAKGRIRCVRTMKDGMSEYRAKGLDLSVEVGLAEGDRVKPDELAAHLEEKARTRLSKMASEAMMDEETDDDTLKAIRSWVKAGKPVQKETDGKKPDYLTVEEVFGKAK